MTRPSPPSAVIEAFLRLRNRCTKRGRQLLRKHRDPELAGRLGRGEVWMGMSVDQLRDAVGEPEAVERQVLGDRIQMTWKYRALDLVRYRLCVVIDGERVVGLDDRR